MTIDEFRHDFDKHFSSYIKNRVDRYQDFTTNKRILQIIAQSSAITTGGKRVRPYLTALSYILHGGQDLKSIQPILFAIEIFHAFCLIHDDIIDDDELRRNTKTIHAFAKDLYQESPRGKNNRRKTGKAQAILVGDLAFSWVFELLLSHPKSAELKEEFFYTIDEVVTGQMIDVDLAIKPSATKEEIIEKMALKTAGYTFVQPLRLGRILAGFPARHEILDQIGLEIGLAFQIQDDLLDIMSATSKIGKKVGSDAETAQHTLLTQFVFDHANEKQIQQLKLLLGTAIDEERLLLLQTLFSETGAIKSLEQEVENRFNKAYSLIDQLSGKVEYKQDLKNFLKYVQERSL